MDDKQYQPGLHKFLHHPHHIARMLDGETVGPMHLSVWPTLRCQCDCSYCCCRGEDKAGEELPYETYTHAVGTLHDYGLKAVEFSGGGEPTLWEHLPRAIHFAHSIGLKTCLITNGLLLDDISRDVLSQLTWVRVSANNIEQMGGIDFDRVKKHTRISISTILDNGHADDRALKWLMELRQFCAAHGLIARVACQQPADDEAIARRAALVAMAGGDPLFFVAKPQGAPLGCYMAWVRAAIDWRGNFIVCPSMHLSKEHEGAIDKQFILCKVRDIDDWLWRNRPHDMGFRCTFCNCGKEHNDFLHHLFLKDVPDVDFP